MAAPKKQQPAAKQTGSKHPAVKQSTDLVMNGISIEGDAGQGFENTDKDSFAIPFLRILQGLSPQVNKANAEFIRGAEQGNLFNTVTKEYFKADAVENDDGVNVVICHFDRKFTEWAPNRGGFRGEHNPSAAILSSATERIDDEGKRVLVLPNGNSISDTRYHFALQVGEDGNTTPVLICMSSSGIKKSKRLMTELNSIKLKNAEGRLFSPPLFYSIVNVKTIAESNDQGDWFNYDLSVVRQLDISDADDADIYLQAKAFRDSIAKGNVKVQHDEEGESVGSEEF
jgi:hypothetical protein